jgi:hypothetical protein
MPEASVTTSSIARYALEKYVNDHIAKRDGTKIFIEVDTSYATEADIKRLYDLLSKLHDQVKEQENGIVNNMLLEILGPVMMRMAKDLFPKKPAEVDGNA